MTEEEVADLKEAFAMFDINGDGACFLNSIFLLIFLMYGVQSGVLAASTCTSTG
jgi:Ca2+-binding EF-hand superfamily protein